MALRLQWSDERYARIYCRDTVDWDNLTWTAQALWMQLNRKAPRSGRIDLGRAGRRGVPGLVRQAGMAAQIDAALEELLADGCVVLEGSELVIPDFVEAQEAVSSSTKRMRELRERRREEDALASGGRLPDGELPAREAGGTGPGTVGGNGSAGTPTGAGTGRAVTPAGRNVTHAMAEPAVTPASRGVTCSSHVTEASPNVTSGYSTARKVQHGPPGGGLQGAALSAALAAELETEATQDDVRRGRVLAAMGAEWRTPYEIAVSLQGRRKRPDVDAVASDLAELHRRGLVERGERGSPPVTHWHVHAVATAVASEDAA